MAESGKNPVFLQRTLQTQTIGSTVLLDALALPKGRVKLFFKSGTKKEDHRTGKGLEVTARKSIGGGLMVMGSFEETDKPVPYYIDGEQAQFTLSDVETHLFAGLNTAIAQRNDESAKDTIDWLIYHVKTHGMDAALIIDRARPGGKNNYAKALKKAAGKIPGLKRLVLLNADTPLGDPNLPSEAHPFNVDSAPGKDRMEIPSPAPWSSPLAEIILYELVRARFLNTARAVMNIDICDILAPSAKSPTGDTIFYRAVNASGCCIQLLGRNIYPWRVRKGKPASFADHICVQFDQEKPKRRWCVAPSRLRGSAVWRLVRVVGADAEETEVADFYRCMSLRHPSKNVSAIVPKTSLIEDDGLLAFFDEYFDHKPVRMPTEDLADDPSKPGRVAVVTTMKNEGPFILEWIAYHRVIGIQDFLVYTNDCTDGTDTLLELLQTKGFIQHRDNPFKNSGLKPQHAALQAAEKEGIIRNADWIVGMDVDEYINVKTGDGTLKDLFKATGDANMIALTWRLFGNGDVHEFADGPITEIFDQCAPEYIRKPHQAWGFKTIFRNQGIFKKLGVHRPKGLKPQLWEQINWVNGSGAPMPSKMFRNGWRSTTATYGYDLVQLNHYAVRSAESFLVKRDRGRVNHVDRDQGLAYWFRMNNNAEKETSIQRMLPRLRAEIDRMLSDPDIRQAHEYCVQKHREKIDELRATQNYADFYKELTSQRMQRLSRMHVHFGANVFLSGPEVVPQDVWQADHEDDYFFNVEKGETAH